MNEKNEEMRLCPKARFLLPDRQQMLAASFAAGSACQVVQLARARRYSRHQVSPVLISIMLSQGRIIAVGRIDARELCKGMIFTLTRNKKKLRYRLLLGTQTHKVVSTG